MGGVTLLDARGRPFWSSHYPKEFPEELVCRQEIWKSSYGEHAERIKQAIGVALVSREPQPGVFSLESPVTRRTYDFQATYQAVTETALVCTWQRAIPVKLLNEREETIVRLAASDMSTKAIADELGITEQGVNQHWGNIRGKLECETNIGAVVKALEMGIVSR